MAFPSPRTDWSLLSALLGNELPGPGTVYRRQDIDFIAPVEVGDTVTVSVTAASRSAIQPKRSASRRTCRSTSAASAGVSGAADGADTSAGIGAGRQTRAGGRVRRRELAAAVRGTAERVRLIHLGVDLASFDDRAG